MRILIIFLTAISLSACGTINSFLGATIADYVPAWAGGLPKDIPPRPTDPRYQQFIDEQRAKLDTSKPTNQSAENSSEVGPSTAGD